MASCRKMLVLCGLLVLLFAGSAFGQVSRTWTGLGSTSEWFDQNNWSPVGRPTSADTVTVTDAAINVDMFGANTYDALLVTSGGHFIFEGSQTHVAIDPRTDLVQLGVFTPGDLGSTMTIRDGAVFSLNPSEGGIFLPRDFVVGKDGPGTLNVHGAGSWLQSGAGSLKVGSTSLLSPVFGSVQVYDGGVIEMDTIQLAMGNGTGSVTVSDPNSRLHSTREMILGYHSLGQANIGAGAEIRARGTEGLTLGESATGHGLLTIRGLGTFSDVALGDQGRGEMSILAGGQVDLPGLQDFEIALGSTSQGSLRIDGAGSFLDARDDMFRVGVLGAGEVEITDGGRAWVKQALVAPTDLGGLSELSVDGQDSELAYFERFRLDSGSLEITGGGRVRSLFGSAALAEPDRIGGMAGVRGASVTIDGDGSAWDGGNESAMVVSAGLNPGTLTIRNKAEGEFARLVVGQDSTSDGFVQVDGAGSRLYLHGRRSDEDVPGEAGTVIAAQGTGRLEITGGANAVTRLEGVQISPFAGADGSAHVSGASNWDITGDLHIGGWKGGAGGQAGMALEDTATVTVSGDLSVWNQAILTLEGGTTMTIGGQDLTLANSAQFQAAPGAKIVLFGTNLNIESTNPADVKGLAEATFVFNGGPRVVDRIEVAGAERGPNWGGFSNNFVLGRVIVGAPGEASHVQLSDLVGNGSGSGGALYVRELLVYPGSTVELGDHNLHVLQWTDLGGEIRADGEGGLSVLGALGRIEGQEVQLRFEPGEAPGAGMLSTVGQTEFRLLSTDGEREELLEFVQVDFAADAAFEELEVEQGRLRFVNGSLTMMDEGGEMPLLQSTLEELVFTEVDGGLLGRAEISGGQTAWEHAFALGYNGQVELELWLESADIAQFREGFDGRATMTITPLPEPTSLALTALGAMALLHRRRSAT